MATKKKEVVETADVTPKTKKATKVIKVEVDTELFKGWKYSTDYVVCPKCGATARATAVKTLGHCPVCGERAE